MRRVKTLATIKEEFELLKAKILAGKGNHVIHVVDHEAERKRKRENPNQSTRIIFNARTPDAWRKFQIQKDRFFTTAVDPHIAVDLITRALEQVPDETLRAWMAEGEEVPDWAK